MGAPLCWLSKYPYDPDDQRFHQASWWKLCGAKLRFGKIISVCDKLSISNYIVYIPSMTSVVPYFCYDFTEFCQSIAQSNPDHLQSHVFVETDIKFISSSLFLHNTTSITVIIEWNVLFVEKIFLMTFSTGHRSPIMPIDGMQTIPKMRCQLQISSYWFDVLIV